MHHASSAVTMIVVAPSGVHDDRRRVGVGGEVGRLAADHRDQPERTTAARAGRRSRRPPRAALPVARRLQPLLLDDEQTAPDEEAGGQSEGDALGVVVAAEVELEGSEKVIAERRNFAGPRRSPVDAVHADDVPPQTRGASSASDGRRVAGRRRAGAAGRRARARGAGADGRVERRGPAARLAGLHARRGRAPRPQGGSW